MEYPKFKVCVQCMTFNHSKYITDCMNGFSIQQTDFPFVCCIIDDASTDGEQEVINAYLKEHFDLSGTSSSYIRESDYAKITYACHKENKNCYFAVLLLKYNHYISELEPKKREYVKEWTENVQYMSYCEGDDYWTDPLKLQKQADVLDSHTDCNMCVHTTIKVDNNGKSTNHTFPSTYVPEGVVCSYDFIRLLVDDFSFHLTSMFVRGDVINEYYKNLPAFTKIAKCGDVPMLLYFGQMGSVYNISEAMSCYRLGAYNSHSETMLNDNCYRNDFYDSIENMMKEFDNYSNYHYHDLCILIAMRYRFLQLQMSHYLGIISINEYNKKAINRKYRYHFKKQYPFKVRMLMYLFVAFPFINKLVNHSK